VKYVVFHKPLDVLSQFSGEGSTLSDYVPVPGIYPVGRLDADSEGLMLLTDDGRLQHRLAEPRYKQPKTYLACVEGEPTATHAAALVRGVDLGGRVAHAAAARVLAEPPPLPPRARPIRERKSVPVGWMEIVLTEGKNRQVRRMTAAVGLPTLRLVRTAIGPLGLEGLPPGAWRWLTSDEVAALRRACGLSPGTT
jgi:23S rRNA pseudouridine2457 synthase